MKFAGIWKGTFTSSIYTVPFFQSLVRGRIEINFTDPFTTIASCTMFYDGPYQCGHSAKGNVVQTPKGFVAYIEGMTAQISLTSVDHDCIEAKYTIDHPHDEGTLVLRQDLI